MILMHAFKDAVGKVENWICSVNWIVNHVLKISESEENDVRKSSEIISKGDSEPMF